MFQLHICDFIGQFLTALHSCPKYFVMRAKKFREGDIPLITKCTSGDMATTVSLFGQQTKAWNKLTGLADKVISSSKEEGGTKVTFVQTSA